MAKEKIHILGKCGTFMGGLAILGKEAGLEVSGCDSNIYPPMSEHLAEMGIDIITGYDPSDLPKAVPPTTLFDRPTCSTNLTD